MIYTPLFLVLMTHFFLISQRYEVFNSSLSINNLWSTTNLVQSGCHQYQVNHFVPCINYNFRRYKVPSLHLNLIKTFKQKLLSPISFVGYPTNFFD